MAKRAQEALHARKLLKAEAQDFATSLQETRKETAELRTQIEALKQIEEKYKSFKQREPEIRHHLTNVAGLAR